MLEAGCEVLMPWGAPIGSGQGLRNIEGLRAMRAWFKDVPLIIDAGIGAPGQAAQAMEMGFDGVLLNTAGLMEQRDMASASTPIFGLAQFS